MKEQIRISIIQPEFKGWDFEYNIRKCEELISNVVPQNPDIICLPELFPGRSLFNSNYLWNLNIPIFFGHSIPPKSSEEKWLNAYSLKDSQNNISSQLKLKLVTSEKENYTAGNKIVIFKINNIKIGVSICHSFAFDFINLYKYYGNVDLLIVPALAPIHHIEYWKTILIVRSIDLKIPIIFINYSGMDIDNGILVGGGNSSIIMPLPKGHLNLEDFVKDNSVIPENNFLLNLNNKEEAITYNLQLPTYNFE
jgi:predicted amidohydrolase